MLIPPSLNLFKDDYVTELDLQRFKDYLFDNSQEGTQTAQTPSLDPVDSTSLMKMILKEDEANEVPLEAFPLSLLKPLQNLPPGRLPGVNLDAETRKSSLPPPFLPETQNSSGNSPKRRRIDHSSPQNVTIQHF